MLLINSYIFQLASFFFNGWARLLKIPITLIQDQKLNEDCISAFIDHVEKSQLCRIMGKIVWKTFISKLLAVLSIFLIQH